MEKNYKTLELDKVLEMLKAETSCEDAGELALNIKPCNDFITLCSIPEGAFDNVAACRY